MSDHNHALAQQIILGGFLLLCTLITFLTLDMRYTGMEVLQSVQTRTYIQNSTPTNCTVDYVTGYNIISVPCITTTELRDSVMGSEAVVSLYEYNPGATDPWKVYATGLPAYVDYDLVYMSRSKGYVALMSSNGVISFEGRVSPVTNVPLTRGWTLAGYPSDNTRNASDAFVSINASYTRVITYDPAAGGFLEYNNPGGGNLTLVKPGLGYWINTTVSTNWPVTSS